jgi:hypothetical protein
MPRAARIGPELDEWVADTGLRVAHRGQSTASADQLWQAAQHVSLTDTPRLARLIRWRIPGVAADACYASLFREPPFVVLEDAERVLVVGLVGRIWTLRRDYPKLHGPDEFRDWSERGTARVVFGHWAEDGPDGGAALASEVRVQAIGAQGRLGVAAVRPLVRAFGPLVGSEGITAALRRADGKARG